MNNMFLSDLAEFEAWILMVTMHIFIYFRLISATSLGKKSVRI